MRAAPRVLGQVAPPVLFGVLLLLVWQVSVRASGVQTYVLAAPSDIAHAVGEHPSAVLAAARYSGLNALVGLLIGVLLGVLVAALCTRLALLGQVVSPIVAALAAVPIVCLAPVLLRMYGLDSVVASRYVVAIAAFVPVYVNTLRGLAQLSSVHRELMASLAASGGDVLRLVRLPGSLPLFCSGLRIATSLAVISAVVSEYFGGPQRGLGSRISEQAHATDYPGAWASVLAAVVLGLVFFVAALLVERLVLGRGRTTS